MMRSGWSEFYKNNLCLNLKPCKTDISRLAFEKICSKTKDQRVRDWIFPTKTKLNDSLICWWNVYYCTLPTMSDSSLKRTNPSRGKHRLDKLQGNRWNVCVHTPGGIDPLPIGSFQQGTLPSCPRTRQFVQQQQCIKFKYFFVVACLCSIR